jgi:copper transport protein
MRWLGLIVLLIALAVAPRAHAHATLIAAEPADGAMLVQAPTTLTLRFNEPVSPLVMRLVRPSGATEPLTVIAANGDQIAITPPALGQGTHALSWRVVSADGHPVGGTLLFSVGAPSAVPQLKADMDEALRAAIWAAKLILCMALLFGAGGAVFVAWIVPQRRIPRPAEWCVALAIGAGPIVLPFAVAFQGLDALALPLSALGQREAWSAGLATSFGVTAILAILALLAAFFSVEARSLRLARAFSGAALLLTGAAFAASGHASAAQPWWLMRPAVIVHAAGLTLWIGALLPLAACIGAKRDDVLLRFSRVIPAVLVATIAAGFVLAAVQLGSVTALWTSAYGMVLLAKGAVVAVLLGLAAANRYWFTARTGDVAKRAMLVRSIGVEIVLALVILGLVALWRFTPPPRALALIADAPATVHIHTDRVMADVTLEPGRAGAMRATILVLGGDFSRFDAKEVTLILSNPAAGIEPIRRTATQNEDQWRVDNLIVPVPGRWQMRVDVLISDFEKVVLEDAIEIRR